MEDIYIYIVGLKVHFNINQRNELLREIYDMNYEIGFKMGLEEGEIIGKYKIANKMLEEDVPIKEIASATKLTMEQIKQLVQTI